MPAARRSSALAVSGPLGEFHAGLLEAVRATGSITRAAAAAGVSYRTAWSHLDRLNALSDKPLVARSAGGEKGGGTRLTPYGEGLLKAWGALRADHMKAVAALKEKPRGRAPDHRDDLVKLARRLSLKTSARNQLFAVVASVRKVGLGAEVRLRLKGGDALLSRITWKSVRELGLKKGAEAFALIKANCVEWRPSSPVREGAPNVWPAEVAGVRAAGGRIETDLRLRGGDVLTAAADLAAKGRSSRPYPPLRKGAAVVAAVDPAHVILGVL